MKLTKKRLIQIIKEEIETIEEITMGGGTGSNFGDDIEGRENSQSSSPEPESDQPVVKDKATLAKELIRIAREEVLRSAGLDSGEAAVIHNILTRVLAMAEEGSTASTLKTLSTRIPDKQS